MLRIDCDIAIVGSGFGGSLLALIARRLGLAVALLERGTHPRFAIGESSTPLADFKLARIADRFGLDWLRSFSKYGLWKATYPEVNCGLKRGFSFFRHGAGRPFTLRDRNANALLVSASPDDARADTHWFRADFDAHLVGRALADGVAYVDRIEIDKLEFDQGWRVHGTRPDAALEVRAGFLVDATGDAQLMSRALSLKAVEPTSLHARSRALYSHFTGVSRWHAVLEESHGPAATAPHPFPCDAAALHQIIDGGWMWVLRFDNGITSAGFSLDPEAHPIRPGESPDAEWRRHLRAYPSLERQFRDSNAVRPFVRTGRLQRRLTQAAGADWALLPHAAGFLDAWLSPGIAQTLFAVERLGGILENRRSPTRRAEMLAAYSRHVVEELAWVDQITGTCFACFDRFEVMMPVSMLYFVAAHYCEERERAGQAPAHAGFLLADDAGYRQSAAMLCRLAPDVVAADFSAFALRVRESLAPYNLCGLGDPDRCNMYPYVGNR